MGETDLKVKLFDLLVKKIYIIATTSNDFGNYVNAILKDVALVLNVDRIFICEHQQEKEEGYYRSYEYTAPNVTKLKTPEFKLYNVLDSKSEETLKQNRHLEYTIKSEIPPKMRESMNTYNVKSILIIPIFVDRNYWGFLTLHECKNDRIALREELETLYFIALNLGAAISVQRQYKTISELNTQLKTALEITNNILTRSARNFIAENELLKETLNVQTPSCI